MRREFSEGEVPGEVSSLRRKDCKEKVLWGGSSLRGSSLRRKFSKEEVL